MRVCGGGECLSGIRSFWLCSLNPPPRSPPSSSLLLPLSVSFSVSFSVSVSVSLPIIVSSPTVRHLCISLSLTPSLPHPLPSRSLSLASCCCCCVFRRGSPGATRGVHHIHFCGSLIIGGLLSPRSFAAVFFVDFLVVSSCCRCWRSFGSLLLAAVVVAVPALRQFLLVVVDVVVVVGYWRSLGHGDYVSTSLTARRTTARLLPTLLTPLPLPPPAPCHLRPPTSTLRPLPLLCDATCFVSRL